MDPTQAGRRRTGDQPFTETVDARRGRVRARGHLGTAAADGLVGTVLALHHDGHRELLLDLRDLESADPPGLRAVRALQELLDNSDGHLALLYPIGLALRRR
ncbi:hypothetical protein [Trujillonella humicola]|uniref:hypothetical protein n=1 Tax=Trujillonella humicola TaxID=3383699 RepID=UPI003905FFF6